MLHWYQKAGEGDGLHQMCGKSIGLVLDYQKASEGAVLI